VDTVVVGYGLTPGTDLSRQINCEFEFQSRSRGFVPKRNVFFETSRDGIFAAGDCAGIGGAQMSMIEGRIAAAAAACKLQHITENKLHARYNQELKGLHREQRFADLLGDLFSPPQALYQRVNDDTIICRCEQITLAEIRKAISCGAQTVADVKNISRSGMGNCQGRTCESIVAAILAAETGKTLEEVKFNTIRPPVHPLPLGVIEEFQIAPFNLTGQASFNHE
jgi:NAD(P)H-nitrite reductase large subunit